MAPSYQHPIVVIDTTDSTNLFAQEMLLSGTIQHGTVIFAKNQRKGRGQRGNTWHSQEGLNLTFSIGLFPRKLNIKRQFELNQFISLAICDYLTATGLNEVHVKWPNDILVNGNKIAGILLENSIRGEMVHAVIAGIGLNVNQELFEGTYKIEPTSIKLVSGKNLNLMEALENLLVFIMQRYNQLMENNTTILRNEYESRLYKLNESCVLTSSEISWHGIIRGIDDEGRLKIEDPDGDIIPHSKTDLKIIA